MYLSIELQSFGVYILSTIFRDSDSATSAGLKYFLLGGLSSCLILLGGGLVYSFTGLTNFESIYSLISVSETNYIIQGLNLGFIFMIVGLLFKIAAAPLHNWAPALCCGKTQLWDKLSNSGNPLKLIVPSYTRKAISG
jgi:NADH-ubiquinone oxidoreductase chain 2